MAGTTRLQLQQLEDRTVPAAPELPGSATFGVPWSESTRVTLSFAPDGSGIAGEQSRLFATLDAQMPRAVWQREILRAAQTWAAVTNVSIGVVVDGGQPFGEPGLGQTDARFGDIRIGGRAMAPRALGITVPHDTFGTGTWSGDIFFNTTVDFRRPESDLYTVALHEIGHALGLEQSRNPASAMADHGSQPRTGLSAGDIAAVQALYGVRLRDPNEGIGGNDTLGRASRVDIRDDGDLPGVALGDITTPQDVDFFEIEIPDDSTGSVSFRVQSSRISLLAPRLTIFSASGQVVGQTQGTDPTGSTATVQLNQVVGDQSYFVRVEAATADEFAVGRYGLAVIFDAANTLSLAQIDQFLRGPYDHLDSRNLDNVLNYLYDEIGDGLIDDGEFDDEPDGANVLEPIRGNARVTHFGTVASLDTAADTDYYRFVVPDGTTTPMSVLTATVAALDANGSVPRMAVLSDELQPIAVDVLTNGNNTFTVQVTGLVAGAAYYIRMSANPNAGNPLSNYALTLDLGSRVAALETFATGPAPSQPAPGQTAPIVRVLYVARPQLIQFLLTAGTATEPGRSVAMTVVDSAGRVVYSLSALAGSATSGPTLFLTPGTYRIRVSATGTGQPVCYTLRGKVLTDPIGPGVDDITSAPRYSLTLVDGRYATVEFVPVANAPYPWSLLDIII